MKKVSLLVLILACWFGLHAYAQSSPAGIPGVSVVVSATPAMTPVPAASVSAPVAPVSAGLIGILIAVVLGLNSVLSALQQIFGSLAKSEPGWLQSLSSIVLEVAKFLGSNPDNNSTPKS